MLLILILVFFMCFGNIANADEMSEDEISESIVKLLRCVPNHKLRKKPEELKKFSLAILEAHRLSNIPVALIIATAYRESTFKVGMTGKIGERGVMQLHGLAQWRYCRNKEDRKINKCSVQDQLICGAHWLRYSTDICDGTYYQGIASYMTKNTCKPKRGSKLQNIVLSRLKLMFRINNRNIKIPVCK